MTASIQAFAHALDTPCLAFRNSPGGGILGIRGDCGQSRIHRLTDFAEAVVSCREGLCLLAMPLHDRALKRAEKVAARMQGIRSPHLTAYLLLNEAFAFADSLNRIRTADLVAEPLPEGRPLSEIMQEGIPVPGLLGELDRMQREFARIGFSHNNLKPENLYLSPGGRLVAIRCHRAEFDGQSRTDRQSFRRLRAWIAPLDGGAAAPEEGPSGRDFEYRGNLFDGLIRIEKNGKFGFVDDRGRCVIKPRFSEAEDFREGRAVVKSKGLYGQIDKTGRFVIPPLYEMIEYDDMEGVSLVRNKEEWAMVDYEGRFLTGFGPLGDLGRPRTPEKEGPKFEHDENLKHQL